MPPKAPNEAIKSRLLQVALTPAMHDELRRLAKRNERLISQESRLALRQYIAREKAKKGKE